MIEIHYYLYLSAALFAIGFAIAVTKKNLIFVLVGIELMLNAANINFVAFSQGRAGMDGHIFSLVVMIIAAAEIAVALAIIMKLRAFYQTVNPDQIEELKY
ncbi:NADH dehydrogenase subunit K [Spirosomataceae bacterium TFI 002]|nr:NADH dehydrogenase subunit K [Spirosomataceae bacterium TFI 002]